MYGRMKNWGLVAGLVCSTVSTTSATEPFVQDFDGWKITIRPGPSSGLPNPVPPSPGNPPAGVTNSKGKIQLLSLRQEATPPVETPPPPPKPSPDFQAADATDDGLPVIIPGESSQCCEPKTTVSPPEGSVDPRYLSQMYAEIYNSIPFNRAEYNANPSYRHDTAVEFLFGKMRPTVVHRNTNINYNYGYSGGYGYGVPYAYGGAGFGYPPLQLVVPGTGLRIHRLN